MGGLFSKPQPMYMPSPEPITKEDPAVQEAAKLEAERLRKRRTGIKTIMTGPSGITDTPGTYKTTLG